MRFIRTRKGWKVEHIYTVTVERDGVYQTLRKELKREIEKNLAIAMQLKAEQMIIDEALKILSKRGHKVTIDEVGMT